MSSIATAKNPIKFQMLIAHEHMLRSLWASNNPLVYCVIYLDWYFHNCWQFIAASILNLLKSQAAAKKI